MLKIWAAKSKFGLHIWNFHSQSKLKLKFNHHFSSRHVIKMLGISWENSWFLVQTRWLQCKLEMCTSNSKFVWKARCLQNKLKIYKAKSKCALQTRSFQWKLKVSRDYEICKSHPSYKLEICTASLKFPKMTWILDCILKILHSHFKITKSNPINISNLNM